MSTPTKIYKYFLFAILISSSCKKQPEVIEGTIRGTVIDHVTKEPVQGARIFFRHRDKCPHEDFEDCWTVLDSTSYISDSLGRFVISYRIEAEYMPSNPHRLSAKPRKEEYFNLRLDDIGAFNPGRDSIVVAIWPKTYLRVRIIDENPDPDRKYDGIRLNHTSFVLWDSIFQKPLDTTIIMVGNPFNYPSHGFNTFAWALFYLDQPQIIGPISTIPQVQCPPHDTCDIEIRF